MAFRINQPMTLKGIRDEHGLGSDSAPYLLSDYYVGGPYIASSSPSYSNYGTPLSGDHAPNITTSSTGARYFSNYFNSDRGNYYTGYYSGGDTTPLKTGFGNGVSNSIDIRPYTNQNMQSGDTFLLCVNNTSGWPSGWNISGYNTATLTCVWGTSASLTVPFAGGKHWRPYVSYDGNYTVTIGGFYSGSSTNYSYGQCYLHGVCNTSYVSG